MAAQKYKLSDGTPARGVTTIIGENLGWSTRGLMYWAWNEGIEGRDYKETKDKQADAGTLAHYLIDCDIKGKAPEIHEGVSREVLDKAYAALFSYYEWKQSVNMEVVATEKVMVSEIHRYGLRPDCIAMIGGKLCVLDYKTSKGVYGDMLVQLAAYRHGWEENFPDQPLDGGHHLLRVGKEDVSFHHHFWLDLDDAWTIFLHLLEIEKIGKALKKRT